MLIGCASDVLNDSSSFKWGEEEEDEEEDAAAKLQ